MHKYRFKEEFKDSQIAVPGIRTMITRHSDDTLMEHLLKLPGKKHNVELIPPGQSREDYGQEVKIKTPRKLEKYSTKQLKPETGKKASKESGKPAKKQKDQPEENQE